jgi:hypothetical protein
MFSTTATHGVKIGMNAYQMNATKTKGCVKIPYLITSTNTIFQNFCLSHSNFHKHDHVSSSRHLCTDNEHYTVASRLCTVSKK